MKLLNVPQNMKEFTNAKPWWRTPVPSEIILSDDGVTRLLSMLKERDKRPFFVADKALVAQPAFAKIFEQKRLFVFDASFSEPRTGDVDALRDMIKNSDYEPDTLVGIGGGATMDLAKATAICLANPKPAQFYQGYDLDMNKGADIWVLPALNGTGAEITPIAVLRGPEKKLGINDKFVESQVAVIDPQLSRGAPHFNRFFTMMDCYFHHYEIMKSRTSSASAIEDAKDGLSLSREVLSCDVSEFHTDLAIKSAMASILGGSSTIGGRVGAAHAISYGLSNSAPKLPHSVAVTISMSALEEVYPDGYGETLGFLEANGFAVPKAADYGITEKEIEKMTKTALGMEKLWHSCFGDDWRGVATKDYIEKIYERILEA